MTRNTPAPMCHVIDCHVIDLSSAGSSEIAAITRDRIAQDAVTPSQPSAEVRDQMRRAPHGTGIVICFVAGIIFWVCLGIAVYCGKLVLGSAMERATHDTAGMICPTPAC